MPGVLDNADKLLNSQRKTASLSLSLSTALRRRNTVDPTGGGSSAHLLPDQPESNNTDLTRKRPGSRWVTPLPMKRTKTQIWRKNLMEKLNPARSKALYYPRRPVVIGWESLRPTSPTLTISLSMKKGKLLIFSRNIPAVIRFVRSANGLTSL